MEHLRGKPSDNIKHLEHTHALEEIRRRRELLNRRPTENTATGPTTEDRRRDKGSHSSYWLEQDRTKFLNVMLSGSKDHEPVDLQSVYPASHHRPPTWRGCLRRCFVAEDSHLSKKFVVKTIKRTQCDKDTISKIRRST